MKRHFIVGSWLKIQSKASESISLQTKINMGEMWTLLYLRKINRGSKHRMSNSKGETIVNIVITACLNIVIESIVKMVITACLIIFT